ncbi:hypothetical protein [Microcoleus asticus]|nr:hypothetical protein [Microcoleus asticus]
MVVPAVLLVFNQAALILLSHSSRKQAAAVLYGRSPVKQCYA